MKKVFVISDYAKAKEVEYLKPLILFYKKGKRLFCQNLELPEKATVTLDAETNTITLKFQLLDSEFLALGEVEGMAKKFEVESQ